jgi:hypothetical protein
MEKIARKQKANDHSERSRQGKWQPVMPCLPRIAVILKAFSQSLGIQMSKVAGGKIAVPELPGWGIGIVQRLNMTIFKRFLDSKPASDLDWLNVGRCFGVLTRLLVFPDHDLPRLFKKEGLDNLTEADENRLDQIMGYDEYLIAQGKKPGSNPKKQAQKLIAAKAKPFLQLCDNLVNSGIERGIVQAPESQGEFLKGLKEGSEIVLDQKGQFSGDRGRTQIYFELLCVWPEIEQMRKNGKSRKDLYERLFADKNPQLVGDEKWFNDICDDIGLVMKKPGRPRK